MSVIQNIREKYAKWAVVAIALALLGFILTDYLSTRNRMFGGSNSTTIGSVNGKKIEYADFENKLKQIDQQQEAQAQQQGRTIGEADRHQNIEGLWAQEVEKIIMDAEISKVGINIGKKELNDWLFGPNAPAELKRQFSNEQGQYNAAAAQDALNQMKKSPNQSDRDQLNSFLEAVEYSHLLEKFNALLTNSIYYPKWYVEKQNTETGAMAKISYVSYPYTKIPDSTVKVSDKEIQEYINSHKEQYKQEESRSIAYVVFSASPTSEDSAVVKKQVGDLKQEFEKATEPSVFLARFGSAIPYYDGYLGKSQIQVAAKDSLFAMAKGAVYGPYLDNTNYTLVKLIDTKILPDSVKARHILVQTADPTKGQMILDDSVGKKRIDSIELAIKNGASFDSLALKLSDDKGSGARGGVLSNPSNPQTDYFNIGQMVKEFNDFSFEGKTGEKKIVKTVFGYHLIEILDQKDFEPHYKAAYFSKKIVASDETDRAALSNASKFASESRDQKSFDENFQKNLAKEGYQKLIANNIKPNDNTIEGISLYGTSRQLVREIYKADKGDVLQQNRVGDKYIVSVVTEVFKEGTMTVSSARMSVEPLLRNKKKAEQIKQKIGKITTLEAAATTIGDGINTLDSLRLSGGQLGFEPRVVGAAFNSANKGKVISEPIEGVSGVYVMRVDDLTATPVEVANLEEQKNQLRNNAKQMAMFYSPPAQTLRKSATIKDNRSAFY
jgi:peptidyl-prolyl cis-trans isomerase D